MRKEDGVFISAATASRITEGGVVGNMTLLTSWSCILFNDVTVVVVVIDSIVMTSPRR